MQRYRLINVHQAARRLGLSVFSVYRLAAKGVLPSYKIGAARRFSLADLEVWLAKQRKGVDVADGADGSPKPEGAA